MPRSEVDVVVVGGGAAGVAAARRLHEAAIDCLIVEARPRLGGRAWTVTDSSGFAVDLGCGWLHSADRNPWVPLARKLGFAVDETAPGWGGRLVRMGFTEAEQADWLRAREDFYQRLEAAAAGPDRPAIELLEPGN